MCRPAVTSSDESIAQLERTARYSGVMASYSDPMHLEFSGEVWSWRGPAPYHFITVPDDESDQLDMVRALVSYGWGVIPVAVRIGRTDWTTSLFPKDGGYLVPIKDAVRKAEGLSIGDSVAVQLDVDA